ncbi:sugar ABC transporter ATP-binding protein [Ruicaihuangia caeni]|uniref:Sugar ABC transporter ATP-binding protein n=1 Tax=Ruicaihuangia caeni TaxID=3042517 RepID=A0AAW6T6A8_9MICO|nr:sugar ABC transporter ATP-binding protein [Klugiella sp. YN-L-19]MDI2099365.1 sugar ABC transporter ATP-binding protein [Klugiella sp. YN-L-19]
MDAMPLVELVGVSKRFGANLALSDVSLNLMPGEVHVLLGENGAGKSTIVKTILGTYQADGGRLLIGGKEVAHHSPANARASGINVVMQDFSLAPTLSVMDNLFLGRQLRRGGLLDASAMKRKTEELLSSVGAEFDANSEVGALPRSEQQLVEIMKAIMGRKGLVVFDEPTAALSDHEAERLFQIVDRLAREGWAILYITHRLAEIQRLGHRVTVIRDGRRISEHLVREVSNQTLINQMVGREVAQAYPPKASDGSLGEVVLKLDNVTSANRKVRGVSLTVRRGEVVAVAGLVGAGKGDVLRVLAGTERMVEGTVKVNGHTTSQPSARKMTSVGVGFMAEDRKTESLAQLLTVHDNLTLEVMNVRTNARFGLLLTRRLRRITKDLIERLEVRPQNPDSEVGLLSGGNQQKVVLARALARQRDLLVVAEPTAGVDVGARQLIYEQLRGACAAGAGILLISSDLEEVIGLADRVYVMNAGELVAELPAAEISDEAIVAAAFGGGEIA